MLASARFGITTVLAAATLFSTVAAPPPMPKLTASLTDNMVTMAAGVAIIKASTNVSAQISLAWDRSPDVSAVGYRIYWGGASGSYTNSRAVGNVTNATIIGLNLNATYYFAATAFNSTGEESPFSNEAVGITSAYQLPVCSLRPYTYLFECTLVPGRTNRILSSTNLGIWWIERRFLGSNGIFAMQVTNSGQQKSFRVFVE